MRLHLKEYDKNRPLISLHIPKCGGTSVNRVLRRWFKWKLYRHYVNEKRGKIPKKHNLYSFWGGCLKKGICIHGHFNRLRGIGAHDYYPEVDQFITFLRDPFEIVVSNFFFIKKLGKKAWRDGKPNPFSAPDADIHDFFKANKKSYLLNFFPFELTWENYKEVIGQYFVYIGIMEDLQQSMDNLALRLGFPKINVGKLNVSPRFEKLPPEFRARFKENNALEYAVYEYAVKRYN